MKVKDSETRRRIKTAERDGRRMRVARGRDDRGRKHSTSPEI